MFDRIPSTPLYFKFVDEMISILKITIYFLLVTVKKIITKELLRKSHWSFIKLRISDIYQVSVFKKLSKKVSEIVTLTLLQSSKNIHVDPKIEFTDKNHYRNSF